MKKPIALFLATLGCATLLTAPLTLNASATTVGDVIAHAYAVGLPEDTIQACINEFGGGTYTSKQCDKAIACLDEWAAQRQASIEKEMERAQRKAEKNATDNDVESETTTSDEVTEDDFIAMSLEEKEDYMQTMSDDERAAFIDNMTNAEMNSMLSQMSTTDQLEVVASLIDVGDAFGISYSVDSVSDDAIVLAGRDMDGNLLTVYTYGETVEKTGYDYTLPILIGMGAIVVACAGFFTILFITRRQRGSHGTQQ